MSTFCRNPKQQGKWGVECEREESQRAQIKKNKIKVKQNKKIKKTTKKNADNKSNKTISVIELNGVTSSRMVNSSFTI